MGAEFDVTTPREPSFPNDIGEKIRQQTISIADRFTKHIKESFDVWGKSDPKNLVANIVADSRRMVAKICDELSYEYLRLGLIQGRTDAAAMREKPLSEPAVTLYAIMYVRDFGQQFQTTGGDVPTKMRCRVPLRGKDGEVRLFESRAAAESVLNRLAKAGPKKTLAHSYPIILPVEIPAYTLE